MWKFCLPVFALGAVLHAAQAPAIAIFLDFENNPSHISVREMEQEVASIMKPSGLLLDWRMLNGRRGTESFPDLVVVKFKGSCGMRDASLDSELGPSLQGSALASTQVADGRILPFSDVECDRVRRYISPGVSASDIDRRDQIYGKALGRVLAHELYHVFAGTPEHAEAGVARAFHTRKDLTAKQFRFSARESATLHELKWRALLAGEGERPSLAGVK